MPLGTIAFLSMAAALGAGSGATFALVGKVAPANKVGSVTGLVGAAGGLGGFVPPLVMGYVYGRTGSYGWGLALLAVVAAATLVFTKTVVRSAAQRRLAEANERNSV
jgi:NNP family nitrate/nitrite transporter-like MFS transporter